MSQISCRLRWVGSGLALLLMVPCLWAQKKALKLEDIMKFKSIEAARISEDGLWLAFEALPDRGDGEGRVHSTNGERLYQVARGAAPALSKDSRWAAFQVKPALAEVQKAGKKSDKLKNNMALVALSDGSQTDFETIKEFAFSDDSFWLAALGYPEDPPEKKDDAEQEKFGEKSTVEDDQKEGNAKKKKDLGAPLTLRRLGDGQQIGIAGVRAYAFSPDSRFLVYHRVSESGDINGVYARDLGDPEIPERPLEVRQGGRYTHLTFSREGCLLAYLAAVDNDKGKPGPASLWFWDGSGEAAEIVSDESAPQGWMVPSTNELSFSRDGGRLFFGLRPRESPPQEAEATQSANGDSEANGLSADEKPAAPDPYDIEGLLKKREVDVWHWKDPRIVSNQKKLWPRLKDRVFDAVYHFDTQEAVRLADEDTGRLVRPHDPSAEAALLVADGPYRRETTWDERFGDLYLVDLKNGERTLVARKVASQGEASPSGRYVVYFSEDHWHLFDRRAGQTTKLTAEMPTAFYDEDHDYPTSRPPYGFAGWIAGDQAALLYDRYDLWKFPVDGGKPLCLTGGQGRRTERRFQAIVLDPEAEAFKPDEEILLESFHRRKKNYGFYLTRADRPELSRLLEDDKRFDFVAKAKKADGIVYTRQAFDEFPDLWVADSRFSDPRRVSEVNPQIEEFAWGQAELVEWNSLDGIPLQGVLIKPANYQAGKRYPVLVYFYRFFSQRLHEFNQMAINHRPNFPYYAGNGYAIFLPDVRFEIGRPGFSATKSLVPGVQKLIDMGVADPKAIGLHGHSWSGYQTAFVITQTNIFAAAVAGAPVSNMTSAYSGIRLGTGLARQFQYEKTQSRIGGSLWEYPERYIANSPVFHAEYIQTPLLIMFGDIDDAVPWEQGIELFLALRRLDKPSVFLQYRGEPHHLKKYANKVDYTIKMKEFFDHYLKGAPAPEWLTQGVPYQGGEESNN